jgi:hypothetical protein
MSISSNEFLVILRKRSEAQNEVAARLRARKFRRGRSRKPPEKTTGQARAVVDDYLTDKADGSADLIRDHAEYI